MMVAFADIDANEYIGRSYVVGFLASIILQVERFGLQQRCQVSASTLRTALECPSRAPISDHQPPTRPGDNTAWIMTATGGENHSGSGWPKPQLLRREDSNGGGSA